MEDITKDRLYGIAKKLYREKEKLEYHLSRCTNELFGLDDKIILYDLTNTYFEGRMSNSILAQYGRSKEKRNDAKLIVLALIVNQYGFLKYSADTTKSPVQIKDKSDQVIELQQIRVEDDTDHYLWVISHLKAVKETSMNDFFTSRFEQGLGAVQRGILTKGGTKKFEKVWERIS